MLQNNSTLKSLIDKLWQNFWEGGIANPLTAIEQITYLIFHETFGRFRSQTRKRCGVYR